MSVPNEVLAQYGLTRASLQPVTMGNINATFVVPDVGVLQRVNPIFSPGVHRDIDAVTKHLSAHGMVTPRLMPNLDGALWTQDKKKSVWRMLTYIKGIVHTTIATPDQAFSAGALLGHFHHCLTDFQWHFQNVRVMHDTPQYLTHMHDVLHRYPEHPAHTEAMALAMEIADLLGRLDPIRNFKTHVVHGDPKLNNFIFDPLGHAKCLIDLDTLGHGIVAVELGDAFRSWCNPSGEDTTESTFDMDIFQQGLTGYIEGSKGLMLKDELQAVGYAIETICCELGARFCADIIQESYFNWDPTTYDAAWQHNMVRTQSQLTLAHAVHRAQPEIKRILDAASQTPHP